MGRGQHDTFNTSKIIQEKAEGIENVDTFNQRDNRIFGGVKESPMKEEQEFFGRGIENQETIVPETIASPKEETQEFSKFKHQVADQVEEVPFEEEEALTEQ